MLRVITLGTGNAFAHGKSFQSAHYLEFENNKKILLDCGPAILLAVQHAEVNLDDLEYLFISHLHGDHMSGIPFLLLSYKYVLQRKKPLKIVGPKGLEEQINYSLKGSYPSLLTKEDNLFEVIELEFEQEYSVFDSVIVKPFEAFHIPNAFCFSVTYKDIKVVYSGDNELQPVQIPQFENTTVLIHELTTMTSTQGGHTSWLIMKQNLEEILSKVKYVVLVHTSQDVRNEPNETFPSNVIRAKDGSVFEFNEKGRMFQMVI